MSIDRRGFLRLSSIGVAGLALRPLPVLASGESPVYRFPDRQWEGVDDLIWWLRQNDISKRGYRETDYDCDDFARDLLYAAWGDGYFMGMVRERDGKYFHRYNFTDIGNRVYYIEPQTDHVWREGRVD